VFGRFWTFPAYDVSLGALLGCRIASPRLSRHNSAACIIGLMALSFHHFSPSPTVWRARWWVASAMACQPLDVGERPAVQLPGPDVLGVHFTGDPLPGPRSKPRCRKFFPNGFVSQFGDSRCFYYYYEKIICIILLFGSCACCM